jgi:hypothetical protein
MIIILLFTIENGLLQTAVPINKDCRGHPHIRIHFFFSPPRLPPKKHSSSSSQPHLPELNQGVARANISDHVLKGESLSFGINPIQWCFLAAYQRLPLFFYLFPPSGPRRRVEQETVDLVVHFAFVVDAPDLEASWSG